MKKLLVVVDMQNDFITGSLANKQAQEIIPKVVKMINGWVGDIITTQDTHHKDYLFTAEGKKLPVKHCLIDSPGWKIHPAIYEALCEAGDRYRENLMKVTFGCIYRYALINVEAYDSITLVGVCTDICVISNALILKSMYPETTIKVDASCCAGVTPESHKNALNAMRMCHIDIINEVGE